MTVFDVYDSVTVAELKIKWLQDANLQELCTSLFPLKACLSHESLLQNDYPLFVGYTYIGRRHTDKMLFAFVNNLQGSVAQAKRIGRLDAVYKCDVTQLKLRMTASDIKERSDPQITHPTAMELAFQQAKRK
jgi:hypothetical protein